MDSFPATQSLLTLRFFFNVIKTRKGNKSLPTFIDNIAQKKTYQF